MEPSAKTVADIKEAVMAKAEKTRVPNVKSQKKPQKSSVSIGKELDKEESAGRAVLLRI